MTGRNLSSPTILSQILKGFIMNQFNNPAAQSAATDVGLRSFLMGTYKKMGLAMIVSMVVAWAFANYVMFNAAGNLTSIGALLFSPVASLALIIGIPVAFGIVGAKVQSMSVMAVNVFLYGFAAVLGIWMSSIAALATGLIGGGAFDPYLVPKVFFMSAAAFAGVSLFGYVTKRDLGPIAKVAFMVFVGFIALMVLGMFIPSMAIGGTLGMIITVVALLAICAITAWETQQLKRIYYSTMGNPEMATKLSTIGAASLLLSFVNIFNLILSLFTSFGE